MSTKELKDIDVPSMFSRDGSAVKTLSGALERQHNFRMSEAGRSARMVGGTFIEPDKPDFKSKAIELLVAEVERAALLSAFEVAGLSSFGAY